MTPTPASRPTDPGTPRLDPPAPILLPLTALEWRTVPMTATAATAARGRVTFTVALDLGRAADPAGTIFKAAVRAPDCRWWVFGRKAFAGPSLRATAARERRLARRRCATAPAWKVVGATWTGTTVTLRAALGARVPKGRYAIRVRAQHDGLVLAERVRSATVR